MKKFVIALAIELCLCWSARAQSQEPLFVPAPASPITVGRGSGGIFLADVNRDGHLDLVMQHLLSRKITVLLGDGKGHFAPAAGSPMHLGYDPGAIALGDVNGDGSLDLGIATRDDASEYVHILLGNGKGSFQEVSGEPFVIGATPKTYKPVLNFVDVNRDGKLDIATANRRRNTIDILFGDGRGGFSAGPRVKPEPGQEFSFALGDVNGDGNLDLVSVISETGGGASRVVIKYGDGKGHFKAAPGSTFSAPPEARICALADMNGDHRLDIVLRHQANLLSVLLNERNGRFTPARPSPIHFEMPAYAVLAADVNRDHIPDLIVATVSPTPPFESKIVVLVGDGRGGFTSAPGSPFPAEPGAYNLAVGDVNEDGMLDIAASSFEGNAVTLLLGR